MPPYPGGYGYPAQPLAQPTSPWAIVSLVCGIVWFMWIGSIVAIVTGHVALREIRSRNMAGRGLAIAGLILGYLGVAILLLYVLFFVVVFLSATGSAPGTS